MTIIPALILDSIIKNCYHNSGQRSCLELIRLVNIYVLHIMGLSESRAIGCETLIGGCYGDDGSLAAGKELFAQQHITSKHTKNLRPGPLDKLGDLSNFGRSNIQQLLGMMLNHHLEQTGTGKKSAEKVPLALQEAIEHSVNEILCDPEEEITGPLAVEYHAVVDGTALTTSLDMLINTSHILHVTSKVNPVGDGVLADPLNTLLHGAVMRYLDKKEVTKYITHINLVTGVVVCWEIQTSFYTSQAAEKFITGSLNRYRKRLNSYHKYF